MANTEIRLIIFFAAKDGEVLYSQQKQDQELTGSDHELLVAKLRLKLKKVGKSTRPFRRDLNQTAYDYTVEVRNKFKGLEWKSRKSKVTWSNRQVWPWSTNQSKSKFNRVWPIKCIGHSKHPLPTA